MGWTLEDLAEKSGLSPHYLSNLENDGRDPSISSIEAISKALGTDAADLVGGMKGMSQPAVEAARIFQTLPTDAQELIVRLMRLLSRRSRRR